MHLGSWRQRILIILGLLLVIVPVIGLPILIKNIFVVVAGLFLITLILTTSDSEQVKADDQSEVLEKIEEASLPSVYHEQVPEFYIKNDLVLSPIKSKTVRRRTTKNTRLKPIEDHVRTI